MTITFFYGVRAIIQSQFLMPKILGGYWRYPGLPSLFVPYGDTSDYYFSRHTGFMVISCLQLAHTGNGRLLVLAIPSTFMIVTILLVMKLHYSIGKSHIEANLRYSYWSYGLCICILQDQ